MASHGGSAFDHAFLYAATGGEQHRLLAITKAQAIVDADSVSGDQYLHSGGQFYAVFSVMSWCDVPQEQAAQWSAWGKRHLGETDGSVKESIWWKYRWSRDNPANNYYHSFIQATTAYVMATGDAQWLEWLKSDRLPKMYAYYSTTPEGGSREGTGYGESHRRVMYIAKMWRDYDGTEVLPQTFIDGTIRYWTHATMPGHKWVALIGDHTRNHGTTDSYHRDIIDNALQLTDNPEVTAIGHWQINRLPDSTNPYFYRLVLRDYPDNGHPPKETEYYAAGAGHFFARDGWGSDATLIYLTAGKHDEAHQHEDQGAFAVWADGEWKTVSDSPWTHGGIAQDVSYQNVIRFPEAKNIHNSVSTLSWSKECDVLTVDMDLSPAVGELWLRRVIWNHDLTRLEIFDTLNNQKAVFGFEKPGPDDDRAPGESSATVEVQEVDRGFQSVVTW